MSLPGMPALAPLTAPSPGPGRGTRSKQKQDIGNGEEDVFWCSRALQRTCHYRDVTGPRRAVGCKYVCAGFSPRKPRDGRDLVTMSHRAAVPPPPGPMGLATLTVSSIKTFAKGFLTASSPLLGAESTNIKWDTVPISRELTI